MDFNLKGKIALVCGASQGIGFATAKELYKEGVKTNICSSNELRIKEAAQQIQSEQEGEIHAYQADMNDSKQIIALADKLLEKFNHIDILVNNTGGPPAGFFMDFSEQQWMEAFKLGFSSAVTLTKKLLPKMVEQKWGRIINLTSISVKQPINNLVLSNSIRMALVGWAKTISNQYAKDGITVNNIATGYTLTDRVKSLAQSIAEQQGITTERAMEDWKNKIPAHRLASPEEIAWMVTFLASDKAGYITGSTIPVDGGFVQNMLG